MSRRSRTVYFASAAALILMAVFDWIWLFAWNDIAVLPLSGMPWLIFACTQVGKAAAVIGILIAVVFYLSVLWSFLMNLRGKRFAAVWLTLVFAFDLAIHILFIAIAWRYLVGIVLDLFLIGICWHTFFKALKSNE